MTDLASLLSCLHRTPGDDLLWLAVADRLEEDGQADRAELIRLSRRLRGMPEEDKRWRMETRVRGLIAGGVRPCVPEVVNSVGMRFALIPAGTFWMGSPEDEEGRSSWEVRHLVTLTRAFWLGVHPVTQAQYEAVIGDNPSYFRKKGGGKAKVKKMDTGSLPVEQVSWEDATAFCAALERKEGLGRVYRLPTEAEWEYSCRGGLASKPFHFGDTLDKNQANFHDSGLGRTSAVGSYPPNAFGLHEMHGNVWEWCADWYGDYPSDPQIDPTGPGEGSSRVLRGGGWSFGSRYCRSAFRDGDAPTDRGSRLGFRVAAYPTP